MNTWERLSVTKPMVKGKEYVVVINVNGNYIEQTMPWTTKTEWENQNVKYWREKQ